MNRDQVLQILQAHRADIVQHGVKSIRLFGSIARNEATPDSDIDLLVEFNRPTGLFAFFRLQNFLEKLLGRKVDLGTPDGLKPRIREHVLRECVDVA